jgi:hypothetical protein
VNTLSLVLRLLPPVALVVLAAAALLDYLMSPVD